MRTILVGHWPCWLLLVQETVQLPLRVLAVRENGCHRAEGRMVCWLALYHKLQGLTNVDDVVSERR